MAAIKGSGGGGKIPAQPCLPHPAPWSALPDREVLQYFCRLLLCCSLLLIWTQLRDYLSPCGQWNDPQCLVLLKISWYYSLIFKGVDKSRILLKVQGATKVHLLCKSSNSKQLFKKFRYLEINEIMSKLKETTNVESGSCTTNRTAAADSVWLDYQL